MKTKYLSKTHNAKGNKHPGIYSSRKDICPTPKRVPYQISLPVEVTQKLQDM